VPWLRAHRQEFDAIIVHGLWQYQAFGAWRALSGTSTPYFVYCHGMLDPWFKHAYPFKHAKKWLYWPWADYRVLRDAAAVCFTAEAERRKARTSFWLYRAREKIASLGVEIAAHDPEKQRAAFFQAHPALSGRRFLLFLGRVHPKKGLDLLLRGYASTTASSAPGEAPLLAIAGPCADASYQQQLRAEAERLGLGDMVIWLPMLSGDIKWGALRACEAFVLFSHQENFSIAVVEALACARPVLISDRIDICTEVAADGAGVVVPATREGAVDALKQWQGLTADGRVAMQGAATASFERRFRIERAVEALGRVIEEACHEPRPA
jgi:glycosyltransferase involved in cell wall biosynthesis